MSHPCKLKFSEKLFCSFCDDTISRCFGRFAFTCWLKPSVDQRLGWKAPLLSGQDLACGISCHNKTRTVSVNSTREAVFTLMQSTSKTREIWRWRQNLTWCPIVGHQKWSRPFFDVTKKSCGPRQNKLTSSMWKPLKDKPCCCTNWPCQVSVVVAIQMFWEVPCLLPKIVDLAGKLKKLGWTWQVFGGARVVELTIKRKQMHVSHKITWSNCLDLFDSENWACDWQGFVFGHDCEKPVGEWHEGWEILTTE